MFQSRNASGPGKSLFVLSIALVFGPTLAVAQNGGNGGNGGGNNGNNNGTNNTTTVVNAGSAVGGISIDASGVIRNADLDATGALRKVRSEMLGQASSDLDKPAELRKISLRKLEAAIQEHLEAGTPLPQAVTLLGGMQRLKYVLVDPEQHDIVLAGFAEGWTVNEQGEIVGKSTGRAVMQLDDLLVALRSAIAAPSVVSCSIDPTSDGLHRLQHLSATLRKLGDPEQSVPTIAETLGPQVVTIQGVPGSSRLARVLVSADYRMKRLAMGLDELAGCRLA